MATVRDLIIFKCEECGEKNYISSKNKRNVSGKLELKKYCPRCLKHTVHKETKV